jgi:hypothetical protein
MADYNDFKDTPEKPGLTRSEEGSRLYADLDRALTDKLLAQSDLGGALARDFEIVAELNLPTFGDIALTGALSGPQSHEEVESLLSIENVGDIAVEGIRLNELLDRGGMLANELLILKRGLLFMNKKMYSEAVEWWTLNRPRDEFSNPRFYCVASLLLALTCRISNRTAQADAAIQEAIRARKLI